VTPDAGRTGRWRRIVRRFDWSDDAGQMGGIETIPFGLLIFVVGTLLVAQAWAVIDVKLAADAAAREGVRAFVEAPDEPAALERSHAAAAEAIAGHGRDQAKVVVDPPVYGDATFARCTSVTLTVHYPVPALTLPWIGGRGDGLVVSASHAEIIDPYRSGLAAGGGC
jgi:hypothetical protein